jgi:hypothetical protein
MKKLKSFNEFFFIDADRIPVDDEQPEGAESSCKNCDCEECGKGECCDVCCSQEETIPVNTNAYRRRNTAPPTSDTLRRPVIGDEVVESKRNKK